MARLRALIHWLMGKRPEIADPSHELVLRQLRDQEARLRVIDAQISAQKAAKR